MKTRNIIGAMALAATLAGPAWAGDFEKGLDAYLRGDYAAALAEWKPLAEQGDAAAQNNLGLMYDNGEGVPQDYVLAYMWYNIAVAGEENYVSKNKDILAKVMTSTQIAEAQRLSRECFHSNYRNCP